VRHCKTNTDFEVRLFTQSSQLPAHWNQLVPKGHFLRSEQLEVYERMQLPDLSLVYTLISVKGEPVAVAYFQILSIRKHHLNTHNSAAWKQTAWKLFTKFLCPKLLVAGHLFRHDICSFYWKEGLATFDAFRMYQSAIKKTLRQAHAGAVLVKDVNESLIPYFQHYTPQYSLLRNDISMEMKLDETWNSISGYEKALKHKYGQRFRKIRQPWEQIVITELSTEETNKEKDVLFKLYEQVSLRQEVRLGVLNESFLPLLKQANDNLHIWLVKHENQPIAFFSAWTHKDVFDMFYIGIDYSKNEQFQLYFNILFLSVEKAIELKKKKLILGRTALEAKARVGCKPKYLSTYLYIRNPLVRNIINRLQRNINDMEGAWENRHPFKAQ